MQFHLSKPPHGESYLELQARIIGYIHRLTRVHPNSTLLLVTHGGTLAVLLLALLQEPIQRDCYSRVRPDNTALTIVTMSSIGVFNIELLNSTAHLNDDHEMRVSSTSLLPIIGTRDDSTSFSYLAGD